MLKASPTEGAPVKSSQSMLKVATTSSFGSSSQTQKVAKTLLNNYGNCQSFMLCNENEALFKRSGYGEKDMNLLMMTTPPSNQTKTGQQMLY